MISRLSAGPFNKKSVEYGVFFCGLALIYIAASAIQTSGYMDVPVAILGPFFILQYREYS